MSGLLLFSCTQSAQPSSPPTPHKIIVGMPLIEADHAATSAGGTATDDFPEAEAGGDGVIRVYEFRSALLVRARALATPGGWTVVSLDVCSTADQPKNQRRWDEAASVDLPQSR